MRKHPGDLAGLPVAGLATAPLAVLAQRDAIRRVALALIGLVVAPLAVLTGEGHCNAHVSAGHNGLPCKGEMKMIEPALTRGKRKTRPGASRRRSLACRRTRRSDVRGWTVAGTSRRAQR